MDVEKLKDIKKKKLEARVKRLDSDSSKSQTLINLAKSVDTLSTNMANAGFKEAAKSIQSLAERFSSAVKSLEASDKAEAEQLSSKMDTVIEAIKGIDITPQVSVSSEKPLVKVDNSSVAQSIESLRESIKSIKIPDNKVDLTGLISATEAVKEAVKNIEFPIPNYVLPFKDAEGKAAQVQLDGSGNLPISASISGADGAIVDGVDSGIKASVLDLTAANPVTTAIVDGNGDQITSFGGGTQYTEGDTDTTLTGTVAIAEGPSNTATPLQVDASKNLQVDIAADSVGLATSANQQTDAITDAELRASPVVVDLGANNDVTVTGTVDLGAVDNAVLDSIATNTAGSATSLGALDNAVDGNYLNVNANIAGTDMVSGSGTATGALRVELPTNGTGVIATVGAVTAITNALPAGTNAIGKLSANSGVDIGDVDVTSIASGTNTIGNVGIVPRTSGGYTTYHLVSGASTNATSVKASAGQLFGWYIYNSNASARKVAFHNTSGTPTAGSSVFFSIVIPPTSGANVFTDSGIAFSSGIGITTVTGLADSDSTGVAANDLVINLFYS